MSDTKYGRVTAEMKMFPEDEPVFILRGKDLLAPAAIEGYANLLRASAAGVFGGCDGDAVGDEWGYALRKMAQEVSNVAATMIAWQAANPNRVKLPD